MDKMKENKNLSLMLKGGASIVNSKPVFSVDSKWLLVCCGDVVKVESVISGECVRELRGHTARVTAVCINPQNQFQALTSSLDGTVRKWEILDGILLKTYNLEGRLLSLQPALNMPNRFYSIREYDNRTDLVQFSTEKAGDVKYHVSIPSVRPHAKAVSVGCKGTFVAAVDSRTLTIFTGKKSKIIKQHVDKESSLTCVAAHPTEHCIATGTANGRILIWYNFMGGGKMVKQVRHWHALAVEDLQFSTDGSYLFSGGKECVLVKWQHGSDHRDTLPRLGAPLVHVAVSRDGTRYATCHSDNSLRVISSNFDVVQHYEGLTRGHLDRSNPLKTGLGVDPRSKALVLNGRPGHLQFYDLDKDKQLYNLDIVHQNYISPDNIERPLVFTEVERLAFSDDGSWLATVERRDDGKTAPEMRLKFWAYDMKSQSYILNTSVDLPHDKSCHSLKFRPSLPGEPPMVVSTSADGKFKLWSLVNDDNIYRKNKCWSCESVGYYRDLPAGPADFSEDGSVLAVGFESTLTLWDPDTNALRTTLNIESKIKEVVFFQEEYCHLMMVATESKLMVWDLLSCSVSWSVPLNVTVVAASPVSHEVAVFTEDNNLHVFRPDSSTAIYQHHGASRSSRVLSAVFIPHSTTRRQQCSQNDDDWQADAQLYFMNERQELLSLGVQEPLYKSNKSQKLEQHLPSTAFSLFMSKQKLREKTKDADESYVHHKDSQQFLKQLLETPAHVMPPLDSLCQSFLHTLMLPGSQSQSPSSTQQEDSDDSDEEMDQSDSDTDSDQETNSEDKLMQEDNIENMDTSQEDIEDKVKKRENQFSSLQMDKFSWLKSCKLKTD